MIRLFSTSAFLVTVLPLLTTTANSAETNNVPADEIGKTVIITGTFGHPIGAIFTIEGETRENGPFHQFLVTAVDGKKLARQRLIDVEGIDEWPNKTKATLKGYEDGRVTYLRAEMTNVSPESAATFQPKQELFLGFTTREVIQPKGLAIPRRR